MPSYFETYGSEPLLSQHALERLNQRHISSSRLLQAPDADAMPETAPGTSWYRGAGVSVVVEGDTGLIVTVW